MYDKLIKKVEKVIMSVARRFTIKGTDFEDLMQIGRITAWEIMEKYHVTEENLDKHTGLISVAIKRTLRNAVVASNRKKRQTLNRAASLDEEFDEDGGTLHDLLLSDAKNPREIVMAKEAARATLIKLAKFSLRYPTPKNKRAVVRFLIHILELNDDDIPKRINFQTFADFGLKRWLWVCFNSSSYRAINLAYPGQFLPYQMNWATRNYWTGKVGRKRAIKVLQKVLAESGYPPEHYPKILSTSFFDELGLTFPLHKIFGWHRFEYLDAAFPGKYHPWEFTKTPKSYFDKDENIVKAVRWLVEEKLGYDIKNLSIGEIWDKEIGHKITKQVFVDYGLGKIVRVCGTPRKILEKVYPGKFLPWSFNSKGKWVGEKGKKLAAEATRWLIEEHLKLPATSRAINCELFYKNGLRGMLSDRNLPFKSSPARILKNAYPNGQY